MNEEKSLCSEVKAKYILLDTETGGLDPTIHSLLELSVLFLDKDLNVVGEVHHRIHYEVYRVTAEALAVNGINLVEHHKDACWLGDAMSNLHDAMSNYSWHGENFKFTLIGHNPQFDVDFIKGAAPSFPLDRFIHHRRIDTASIIQMLKILGRYPEEKSASLTEAAAYFDVNVEGAHSAKRDVHITLDLLRAIKERL